MDKSKPQDEYKPRNLRIFTYTTKDKILHVEDCLDIGKIKFEMWHFEKGKGSRGHVEAYASADEVRVLLFDLARQQLADRFQALGGSKNGAVIARVLLVELTNANNPVAVRIENGPGVPHKNGLIEPAWWRNDTVKATKLSVLLPWFVARQLALAVQEHMAAWAAATYFFRRGSETWAPDALPTEDDPALPSEEPHEEPPTAPARAATRAEEDTPSSVPTDPGAPSTRGMSEFQRGKIEELYKDLFPDRDPLRGADAHFRQRYNRPLSEATYDEARGVIAGLLRRKRKAQVS